MGVCGKPRNLEEVIDQLVVPTGKGPGHVTVTGFCGLWDPCNLYSLYSFVSPKPNLQDSCWGCVEAYPLSACRCDRYSALVGASGFYDAGGDSSAKHAGMGMWDLETAKHKQGWLEPVIVGSCLTLSQGPDQPTLKEQGNAQLAEVQVHWL